MTDEEDTHDSREVRLLLHLSLVDGRTEQV